MRDAETGQRGFLLTLNEGYLGPYYAGIENANSKFKILKDLTHDNSLQQSRLAKIKTLIYEKKSELNKTIQLAKQNKLTDALAIVNSDKGKIVMDTIRQHIKEFRTEENHLLKNRSDQYYESKQNLNMFFLSEFVLLVLLIILAYFLVQKNIVKPLVLMTNYIAKEGDNIDDAGINTKKRYDEIGMLIEAFNKLHRDVVERTKEKDALIAKLKSALDEVETLKGIIPICSYCHKIRDDEGSWDGILQYIAKHSSAQFSHGVCPDCLVKIRADEGFDDKD